MNMTTFRLTTVVMILLGVYTLAVTGRLTWKPCLHPTNTYLAKAPTHKYNSCLNAEVPQRIPLPSSSINDTSPPFTISRNQRVLDVCSIMAHSVFVDLDSVDIVFLNQGSCNKHEIQQGVLTSEGASQVLPYKDDMVIVYMQGKDILAALEHGFNASKDIPGAYPVTEGIQFTVDMAGGPGKQIYDVKVLGYGCELNSMVPKRIYKIRTSEYLINGGDGYEAMMPKIHDRVIRTRKSAADCLWKYARKECRIENPIEGVLKAETFNRQSSKLIYNLEAKCAQNKTSSPLT